jgi:hypothetical protein
MKGGSYRPDLSEIGRAGSDSSRFRISPHQGKCSPIPKCSSWYENALLMRRNPSRTVRRFEPCLRSHPSKFQFRASTHGVSGALLMRIERGSIPWPGAMLPKPVVQALPSRTAENVVNDKKYLLVRCDMNCLLVRCERKERLASPSEPDCQSLWIQAPPHGLSRWLCPPGVKMNAG